MQRLALILPFCGALMLSLGCQVRASGSTVAMKKGPYSSVDKVPVPELPSFSPEMPEKTTLSNGMIVLLMRDTTRPVMELSLEFHTGSYADPMGMTGLASLTAEVMRSGGSGAWPGDQLDEELAFLGAEIDFGAGRDFFSGSLACLSEDFDQVLGMFQDMLHSPAFPQDKLDLALDGMRNEVLQRNDNPGSAASREAQRAFFGPDDPRSRRVEMTDLDAIGRGDLSGFHREHLGSKGAQVSVYGDFDRAALLQQLEQTLGGLPAQSGEPQRWSLPSPSVGGRRVFLVDRDDVNQAQVRMVLPGVRADDPDYAALRLGSFVFGTGGFSNRMVATVRTEMGLAYSTGAFWQPAFRQPGVMWAWAGTKNETCALAVNTMLEVFGSFLAGEVDDREFEGARQRLLNAEVFKFDTRSETLGRIADLEFYGYPWDHDQTLAERTRSLGKQEVLEVTRRYMDLDRLTFFIMGNAAQFDGRADQFGSVVAWDLDAPDGGVGARSSK